MTSKNDIPEDHSQSGIEKIRAVKQAHEASLLSKANVVGVGIGLARRGPTWTQEMALIVLVRQKVPVSQLDPEDIIPRILDGVPVDVQEVGNVKAQD